MTQNTQEYFVEQAEYLSNSDFQSWVEEHPHEKTILNKLTSAGAKLITGPRGCGKTTLLLKAFHSSLPRGSKSFPVYVNFKSSLRLEPLYKDKANARHIFSQWLLIKCFIGVLESNELCEIELGPEVSLQLSRLRRTAELLETNGISLASEEILFTIDDFRELIDRVLQKAGRVRCVLLLDDAAHAFSPEQQRDFFDFFRRIKSIRIAPKAAIYPGVTVISPTFQVGHDAEEIDVWVDPYEQNYLQFMRGLLLRRFPDLLTSELQRNEHLVDLLCFSAFGIPRSLLNMFRSLVGDDEAIQRLDAKRLNSRTVLSEVRSSFDSTTSLYRSLSVKLPMYREFIEAGDDFVEGVIGAIKQYNASKSLSRKSVEVALSLPLTGEMARLIGFLEYAGLLRPSRSVSRGVKGRFGLYSVHCAGLIARNAILAAKSPSVAEMVGSLRDRNAHEFTRVSVESLLDVSEVSQRLQLTLPPCQSCGAPRAAENAKFCLECGSPLVAESAFKILVNQKIEELPLSETRVARIKQNTDIRTIGDILIDHDHRKLRSVPWVGPYWADRIYRYAEEFIA